MENRLVEADLTAVAVAALTGGSLTGLVSTYLSRKKIKAEGDNVQIRGQLEVVSTANELVVTLREEMDRLSSRVASMDSRIVELHEENLDLRREVTKIRKENEELRQENSKLRNKLSYGKQNNGITGKEKKDLGN